MREPIEARKLAFLFPGQAVDAPFWGHELAQRSEVARELLERAGAAVDIDLTKPLRRGGWELKRTAVLQPAVVAMVPPLL